MKCIEKYGKIQRVSDDKAHKLVTEDGYKYCPKSKFKEQKGGQSKKVKGKKKK